MPSFKYPLIVLLILVALLADRQFARLQEAAPHPRNPDAEAQIITQINQWRIRRDLVPLQRNSDLDYLALTQAQYMIPRAPNIPDGEALHIDRFGDGVFRRAELVGWPSYEFSDQILISEVAAYYPTVELTINFWQSSLSHKRSVENPGFREIGVAVLHHHNWMLTYVVMGGRPGVLPVTFDPATNLLFLSTDRSVFSDEFQPSRVQILDAQGERLHDDEWLVWSDRMRLPYGANGHISVIVSDGIRETRSEVDLYSARIFPSDPTPTPTFTPTITPTPSRVLATATPRPPTPTPIPSSTPVNGSYAVVLRYDDEAFTLINQSTLSIDLSPLSFVSTTLNLEKSADWLGRYSLIPISEFPPGYCMQAWSYTLDPGPPDLPDECRLLASGRSALTPGERFWLAGRFNVVYDRVVIAQCYASAEQCAFDIPEG